MERLDSVKSAISIIRALRGYLKISANDDGQQTSSCIAKQYQGFAFILHEQVHSGGQTELMPLVCSIRI